MSTILYVAILLAVAGVIAEIGDRKDWSLGFTLLLSILAGVAVYATFTVLGAS